MNNDPKTIEITDPRSWIIKGSIASFIVIGAIILGAVKFGETLLDMTFLTDSAYAADKEKVEEQVAELKVEVVAQQALLEDHIGEFSKLSKNIQLADAVGTYRNAEQSLYLHELDEDRNGETPRSATRRRELTSERNDAKEFRDCVVNNRPNCEALRPR